MYTDEQRRGHIRDLQRFLRRIQRAQGHPQPLTPDGIYGPETRQAVRDFQQRNGLPITGTVNYSVWTLIYAQYLALTLGDTLPAEAAFFPPGQNGALSPGDKGAAVFALQLMLGAAAPHFADIPLLPLTGEYDSATAEAVRRAQTIFQLTPTGVTDRRTWEALSLLHNSFFGRTPLAWLLAEQ